MKISIVTPCYNSIKTIRQTFDSILLQSFVDYEYIVVDGASTDGTIELIKEYELKFKGRMRWISEPDNGIYEAIQKGFAMASGDILAWIGSDDVYMPNAFKHVYDIFERYPQVQWLTGETLYILDDGTLCEACHGKNWKYQDFCMKKAFTVQQEATFWRHSLWKINQNAFGNLRYAGDYALWMNFSRTANLYPIPILIAAFHIREGQTSTVHKKDYMTEVESICRKELKSVPFFLRITWNFYYWLRSHRFFSLITRFIDHYLTVSKQRFYINKQTQKFELR